jgi:hypothetical protein
MKGLYAITILIVFSCQAPSEAPDLDAARAKILELHDAQRDYHFEKRASESADLLSEEMISVNRGEISSPTREENETRFGEYFASVEFVEWDDQTDPVIRFSDDGTMAYTVVDKKVTIRTADQQGQTVQQTTEFAWVAIYRKKGDSWEIECVASTNKEPVIEAVQQ